jgi:hypothetical protein
VIRLLVGNPLRGEVSDGVSGDIVQSKHGPGGRSGALLNVPEDVELESQ